MKRLRLIEIVQQKDKIDLDLVFNWLDKIDCQYLCVYHDKDNDDFLHYHIMLNLASARFIEDVAKQCDVEPQFLERGKSTFANMCAYAFHLTDNCENDGKYIYDESAVVKSRGVDIAKIFEDDHFIKAKKEHNKLVKDMLYKYGGLDCTREDVIKLMTPEDYDVYEKLFKKMRDFRTLQIKERKMQVIYITGFSGSGKTTLAKFMAISKNYDYFVSGSGRDLLDGYDKQECIILDDFRSDFFTKAELFKLTDNNTNSAVKSRYSNKDISNCKLLIITSIKTPHELYNWLDDKDESFFQFARRLQFCYITVSPQEITTTRYDITNLSNISTFFSDFKKDAKIEVQALTMNQVYNALGIIVQDGNAALNDMFSNILDHIKK